MAARLFLLLSLIFLLSSGREPPWADSHVVYDTTQALVTKGELSVTLPGPPQFFAHRNGRKYGVFPLGNVVAMIPSYLAFSALSPIPGIDRHAVYCFTSHLSPALLLAGACALFYRLARRRAEKSWALLLSVTLGVCTLCFCYGRSPYSEALQTFAMVWLCSATIRASETGRYRAMASLGLSAGVLFSSKLVYALCLPLPAVYLAYRYAKGGKSLGQFAKAAAVALLCFAPFFVLALWHNQLKTGSILDTGYRIPNGVFSGDLLPGLYGFLLSTGKGMFFYSPPLFLLFFSLGRALAKEHRAETLLYLSLSAAVLLFNAKFRHWHADYCWGPRHLCAVTPLLLLCVLPWLPEAIQRGSRRLRAFALGGLLTVGFLVQLLGASIYWDHYIRILISMKDQTGAGGWFHEQLGHGHYIPQFSPLRGQAWMLSHLLRRDPDMDRDAPWKLIVPQKVDLSAHYTAMRLDFWLLDWTKPGPKGDHTTQIAAGLILCTGLLGIFFSVRSLRRDYFAR